MGTRPNEPYGQHQQHRILKQKLERKVRGSWWEWGGEGGEGVKEVGRAKCKEAEFLVVLTTDRTDY